MAELVDATDLKSVIRKGVQVRFLSGAPINLPLGFRPGRRPRRVRDRQPDAGRLPTVAAGFDRLSRTFRRSAAPRRLGLGCPYGRGVPVRPKYGRRRRWRAGSMPRVDCRASRLRTERPLVVLTAVWVQPRRDLKRRSVRRKTILQRRQLPARLSSPHPPGRSVCAADALGI